MLKFASRSLTWAAMVLLVVTTGGVAQASGQNAAGPTTKSQVKKTTKKR